ncbi:MAG: hypothetical protein IKL97_05990, partial [Eggerthellaceae bacterium]|nr:hypothetical protein [Eggerthellaceae bacterium]
PGVRDVVGSATVASIAARDNAAASNSVIAETAFDLATQAGILNPGVIRSYEFTWRVPDGLSGETPLTVRVLEDGSAPEGSQSSNGVSSGEGSWFASGALFASAVNSDISASSIDSSVLFRVPSVALDEDGSNVPGGSDGGSGESGGPGEGSGNDASGESDASGNAIPGGSGGLSAAGDDLSSTAMATLLAGLGLAGVGIAAKKLGDEDGEAEG